MRRGLAPLAVAAILAALGWWLLAERPERAGPPTPPRERPRSPEASPRDAGPRVLPPPDVAVSASSSSAAPVTSVSASPRARTDSDLDALAAELRLSPQQRERVRLILLDLDAELARALRVLPNGSKGQPDPEAVRRAGEETVARAEERLREALEPEQRELFDKLQSKGSGR